MKAFLATLCFIFAMTSLSHMARAEVSVSIDQGKLLSQRNDNGETVETVIPLEKAVPGETIVYRYVVTNTGDAAAEDVTLGTDVPENMTYVAGSGARDGWIFEVSADGQSYDDESRLVVYEIDETSRPATAADIRALRWRLLGTVEAGETLDTAFRATLDR